MSSSPGLGAALQYVAWNTTPLNQRPAEERRSHLENLCRARTQIMSHWTLEELERIVVEAKIAYLGELASLLTNTRARGARSAEDVLALHQLGMSASAMRAYGTARITGVSTIVDLYPTVDGYTARRLYREGCRGAASMKAELRDRASMRLAEAEAALRAEPELCVQVREQGRLVRLWVRDEELRVDEVDAQDVARAVAFEALGGDSTRVARIQAQWHDALAEGALGGVITGALAARVGWLRQRRWALGVLAGGPTLAPAPHERGRWGL